MKLINKPPIILFVFFTNNNIICTITNFEGKTLMWSTSGSNKINGIKKITTSTIFTLVKKLYNFNNISSLSIYVRIKGISKFKINFVKHLKYIGFNILTIQEKFCFPHAGCKKSKSRKF